MINIFKKRVDEYCDLSKKQKAFFAVFLSIILSIVVLSRYVPEVPLTLFAVTFSILLIILWGFAGKVVFDALAGIAAKAAVVVSVIIFLSTTYCDLPQGARTADESLQFLFVFGVIYAAYYFYKSLAKSYDNGLAHLKVVYSGKVPLLILFFFVLLVVLFLWQLYEVVKPIVSNFCFIK